MTLNNDTENKQPIASENETEGIDYQGQFLRVSADFANYKRRIEKERLEWMQTAQASVIQKMLPIADDLERALAHAQSQTAQEMNALIDGFVLIQKNLKKVLEEQGVQEINTSGAFDPEFHEALVSVQTEDKQAGDIVDVLRKGYLLKGKVLRHAQVSVAK